MSLKSKPQTTSFLNLPTVTVSFRSYLHRCFGKVFKFRHVNNNSPVAWATSKSLSNESPKELGEDTLAWPLRPLPSEVEVMMFQITFSSTFFKHFVKMTTLNQGPTGLGSSRVTTGAGTQLFEQVESLVPRALPQLLSRRTWPRSRCADDCGTSPTLSKARPKFL